MPLTVNDNDLTENSAIAILALLIHDLEGGVLQSVLQIGNGGDYLVQRMGDDRFIQVEVSGIKEDSGGTLSRARLKGKTDQVLRHDDVGYVSVTTFSHEAVAEVHSYLHFVKLDGGERLAKKNKKCERRKKQ